MTSEAFATIVMAAGQGTRMRSTRPKVLHRVGGRPLYAHVVQAALDAGTQRVVVVVGHGRQAVEASVAQQFDSRVTTAVQAEQRGTGDAAREGLATLPRGFEDWVVILSGDTPLVPQELVEALMQAAVNSSSSLAMVTSRVDDPTGYGRVLRDENNAVRAVVEQRDANPSERAIREINPALYAVRAPFLRQALSTLRDDNAQGELYLTDIVARAARDTQIATIDWPSADTQGVNDRAQLAECERVMRLRTARALAQSGVTVMDPATTYVEVGVEVAPDAVLEPNVHLRGTTQIGAGASIGTGCVLEDVHVDELAVLKPYTVASRSRVGPKAEVGPFSHLRPESQLDRDSKVGNFVEVKKTRLGAGSKASHLAYLGDGEIGIGVNVGAGTIFCNYDGYRKHTTVLEDGAFIGSDSQLIAPVRVGKNAYVGTGTTVTHDVPENALAISRVRQSNKEDYATRLRARLGKPPKRDD